MSTKSVLIINRTSPYGSSSPREALDIALTCSIFEQPVSLLFLGAGIFQLLNNQNTESIEQKNLESIMSSLPMYDIDQLYTTKSSLEAYDLTAEDLSLPVQIIDDTGVATLINGHETVLTF